MTVTELEALLDEHTPHWRATCRITSLGKREIVVTMPFRRELTRAGGTIAGPPMMLLVDRCAYYLTNALAGPVPDAVTANLTIHFLARPRPGDVHPCDAARPMQS